MLLSDTVLPRMLLISDTDISGTVGCIALLVIYTEKAQWKIIFQKEDNMDIYTIWADKEGDISDLEWVNNMKSFFDHLVNEGKMETYRITRCKMGFRSIADMPEWMILMEFKDMAQMDNAFKRVAPLEGELEVKHKSFNQFVGDNIQHALFRDWPDV